MDGDVGMSVDKLPIRRLAAVEETGVERFPTSIGYDEKLVSLIQRIDFAWAVEKEENEKKRLKKSVKESSSVTPLPWQSMVESLQLAHQELAVILDLITAVEGNVLVSVAGMTRPKPQSHEILADLAVSVATKHHSYGSLSKYFKKYAKALEQQITREARFYGALIRLQKNWKVKRQRMPLISAGKEGFIFDLSDILCKYVAPPRGSSLTTIHIDHDSAGMLAIDLPENTYKMLHLGFLGVTSNVAVSKLSKFSFFPLGKLLSRGSQVESVGDDECVVQTHSVLRRVHQSIFQEQVFEMVSQEACKQSMRVNVTGLQENHIQLNVNQETSMFLLFGSSVHDGEGVEMSGSCFHDSASIHKEELDHEKNQSATHKPLLPSSVSYELYLQQIFHGREIPSGKNVSGLLSHFCSSVTHRLFSKKVLAELENVVWRVPYLCLISNPTWLSRSSSWTILMSLPPSQLLSARARSLKRIVKSNFRTVVLVHDDCINIEADGSQAVVGLDAHNALFKWSNKYHCQLAELPMVILQQAASQVICWLHQVAHVLGIKAKREFLSLSLELQQGEIITLAALVDPEPEHGSSSISWSLKDGSSDAKPEGHQRLFGHLSPAALHSMLLDLVGFCGAAAIAR